MRRKEDTGRGGGGGGDGKNEPRGERGRGGGEREKFSSRNGQAALSVPYITKSCPCPGSVDPSR